MVENYTINPENLPDLFEEHSIVLHEEYELGDALMVGGPIRTDTGGFVTFYTQDGSDYVIITNSPERYNGSLHVTRKRLQRLGGGILTQGMQVAVDLLNNPLLDEEDDSELFFGIADQIQGDQYTKD